MDRYFYKLTELELAELVNRGLVSTDSASNILFSAMKRKPGKFSDRMVSAALNKAGTIRVQNVHFYGGEHFGEPYRFVAEIVPETTNSAWSAFVNRKLQGIPMRYFTY